MQKILFGCVCILFSMCLLVACKQSDNASQDIDSFEDSPIRSSREDKRFNPNEPIEFTKITERSFSGYGEGWFEQGNDNFSIVQENSAPRSPKLVGRITYPVGFEGGYEPAKTGYSKFSSKKLYVSFSIKHSDNWQGHPSGVNKILFITDSSTGGGGDPMYFLLNGTTSNYHFEIRKQGSLGSENFSQNISPVSITPGDWVNIELLLVMNSTPGKSDGEAHLWVNGQKTSEHTAVLWSDGNCTWDSIRWEPIWGGIGDSIREKIMMYVDHIYVSGQ